ncbi:ABC-F family ATP-binding cassette domain-containing protein [Frankia sp. AgB32]|uniref:ABC-F family ATP-binding cassette domain-containing protein n=1 Tax=Frankia sp. AgB32 TaxID=631119 RepID=UPI0027E37543|nr:ABC-F family ATP-binding cassette domain-containing protein [Frankia sp. AgB32]
MSSPLTSTQLTLDAASKFYDHRPVLREVTCSLPTGARTGIIGENGSGKSTLLRLLAGVELPDDGRVIRQAGGGIGHLPQEATPTPGWTVADAVDDALADLRAIEARLRALESAMSAGPPLCDGGAHSGNSDGDAGVLAEYGTLLAAFELRGGYDADARVEQVLHGVGLGGLRRDRPLGALSGGQQARLRLACVLAAGREVLLLDEPTNHLDDDGLAWLASHLRARTGTTAVVSHDRIFLDQVADTLIEVDGDTHGVRRYGDGYGGYLAARAATRARRAQAHATWTADVARQREAAASTARRGASHRGPTDKNKMSYGIAGDRVQQAVASRVRNAEERLRRLLDHPVAAPPQPLRFALPAGPAPTGTGGGVLFDAVDVSVAGRLAPVTVAVPAGGRLLVDGANGAGKSTLLRVLAGELAPDHGTLTRRATAGHLPQRIDVDDPDRSLLATFARGHPGDAREHAAALLSFGLFTAEQLSLPIGRASAGQRQRLALARVLRDPVDVLLLDEPTNHLSLALVEELQAALDAYPGAIVLVSHDRAIRRRWHDERLTLLPPETDQTPGPVSGGGQSPTRRSRAT